MLTLFHFHPIIVSFSLVFCLISRVLAGTKCSIPYSGKFFVGENFREKHETIRHEHTRPYTMA